MSPNYITNQASRYIHHRMRLFLPNSNFRDKLLLVGSAHLDSFDDIGNIDALPPLRSHRLETSHPTTQVSPKQKGSKKEILNRGLAQETSIGIRATEETSYPMGSPELGMRTAPTLNQLGPEPAQSKGILFGAKKPISPPTKPSDKEAQVQVRINNLVKAPGQNGSSNPKRVFLAIDTEEATVLAAEKMKGDETSHAESAPRLVLERSESNTRLNPPNEMPVEERKMFWASVLARSPNPTPTNRIVPQIRLLGIEGSLGGGQSQDIKKDQSPKKNESPRQPDSNRLKMLAGFLLSKAGSKDPEMGGKTAQTMKFKFPGLKGVMSAAKRMLQTGSKL